MRRFTALSRFTFALSLTIALASVCAKFAHTAHARPLTPTSRDYDLCARTVWGEARGQSQEEQAAIVHVAYNRYRSGRWGRRFEDVFLARRQFSTWNVSDPNFPLIANLDLDQRDWRFKRALMICAVTINARDFGADDPTHGRRHFYHGDVVPYWAKGRPAIKIGAATFVRTR